MVLVQNKYKNTLVGVLRTQITFVTHSSPSCYVTLRTQVIRLNSGNLGPQKTDSGVFIIISHASLNEISVYVIACFRRICLIVQNIDYRGNEKYVLVLVQCHDGIITNSINHFLVLHSSWTRA